MVLDRAIPPILLGETYAVCAAVQYGSSRFVGQSYLITQRGVQSLEMRELKFTAPSLDIDGTLFDLDFTLREAEQQCHYLLNEKIAARAAELKRPELELTAVALTEASTRPFVGCWMRGLFHEQLRAIQITTYSWSLGSYLDAVCSLGVFKIESV